MARNVNEKILVGTLLRKENKAKQQISPAGMTAPGDLQALVTYHSQKQSSTTLIGNNAIAVQTHAVTTDMLCLF